MSDLTVNIIDSKEDFYKMAPEWNALLDESSSGSVFLTWEWLSAWSECYLGRNRSLFILAFYEKSHLVGIAPFYVECKMKGPVTLREIHFLGGPEAGSDYLDVFARKGHEKTVADTLYDYLMGDGKARWDVVHLLDIPADALFLLYFNKRVQLDGKFTETASSSFCPVVRCGSENELFEMLSQTTRKKFKQDIRVIHREQDIVHSVIHGVEVVGALEEFFKLYERKSRFSGKNLRPILDTFLSRCNGDSPVQIDLLSVSGQVVAGLLHLRYRNTLAMYLMAIDKEFNSKISLGNILVGLCIKNSIAAGLDTYDFLKGDESYKFHWASGGRSNMKYILWQKNPAGVVSALGRLVRHAGKVILR